MTPYPLPSDPNTDHPAAVVIGGANVDFKSQTSVRPIPGTSNPGRSRSSSGGVGRNIAENLARLGASTALVTAVGDDANGARLLSDTESAGVNIRHIVSTRQPTGTYTAILDDGGEMIIAVASTAALDDMSVDSIAERRELISHAQILILDCNVPEKALVRAAMIAAESSVRVVVDPVSVAKTERLLAILRAGLPLHTVTPNLDELQALTGAEGCTDSDLRLAAAQLHSAGVEHVWVRLGVSGSFLSSMRDGVQLSNRLAPYPATLIDVTGAGDAMLAGYALGLLRGCDSYAAAKYGRAAAAITVESEYTVNPSIDFEALSARVAGATE